MPRYPLFDLVAEMQPDPAALVARLKTLDPVALIELAADLVDASAEVRESFEGPLDAKGGYYLSEGSTEDLTGWIVAQGESYWRGLVGASDEALIAADGERDRELAANRAERWSGRTPDIRGQIFVTYRDRFGARGYHLALERVLAAR